MNVNININYCIAVGQRRGLPDVESGRKTPPVPVTSCSLPLDSQHASPLTVGIDDTASAGHDDPSLSDVTREQPWMPKGKANQLQASESTGTVAITITTLIEDDVTGNQTWWS